MISTEAEHVDDFDPFAEGVIERVFESTEAQREIWLADRLAPQASLAYNESTSLMLHGRVQTVELRAALDALVARHDALRATLSADGLQLLIGEGRSHELPLRDFAKLDAAARNAALARVRTEAVETRFDLEHGPLFRAELLRHATDQHELLLTAHHIVCDGWSWGQIVEEIGLLYTRELGKRVELPEPLRYEDYAHWSAAEAASPAMEEHARFWTERFSGSTPPPLELPVDRPRPPMRSFESRRVDVLFEGELVDQVRKRGAASGASLFSTLFATFAGTLQRLSQQDDLVIGVAASGQSASDMPTLVGHCVNVLPIRIGVDQGLSMEALVQQSSTTLLDAFEHQTLTYGTLLKKLQLKRDPSRPTLVSVIFNLDREVRVPTGAFPGLEVEITTNPRHFENFELFLNCTPTTRGLQMECQYNTGLFDDASVRRWLELFRTALERFAADPELSVAQAFALGEGERALLARFNDTAIDFQRDELLHAPFERLAATQPDAPALRFGERTLSYAELNREANRIAHRLIGLGLRPDDKVGLCADRSVEMVAALLGILKAGAAYVPLDPAYPADRLAYMLRDAAPSVVLTQAHLAARVPAGERRVIALDDDPDLASQPTHDPDAGTLGLNASHTAYVIYTSGSTGLPKGVMNEHRGVVNRLTWAQRTYGLGPGDKVLQKTPFSFDVSVWEFFWTLRVGAQLVVARPEGHKDPAYLTDLLRTEGITTAHFVPSMLQAFLAQETLERMPALRRVLCSGEALPVPLAQRFHERLGGVELHNLYGPTEAAIDVTAWACLPGIYGRSIPIGRPVDNTQIHVLDPHLQPLPIGTPGEIYIGGVQVARGYLNRTELTAERFIADPFASTPGARLYKTGDLGRWLADGSVEYLGRNDFQVKVRGFRIELGEIETRLGACAGVGEAVVMAREDAPGDTRLVGYVSPEPGVSLSVAALREALAAVLPEYMVPSVFVVLPVFPQTTSGKVDRKALPAPEVNDILGAAGPRQRIEPADDFEREVLGLMEQVLSLPGLSMDDDFFALGGHSLMAARLTATLSRRFDIKLSLATLFESPTPQRLARAVAQARQEGSKQASMWIPHRADQRSAPLTPMQERIRFIEELHPGRPVYNVPSGHRLRGPFDRASFEAALREIVRRQPVLRSVIGTDPASGAPVQFVRDQIDFDLPFEDLSAVPDGERESVLLERMQAVADKPMDIYRGPPFRAALFRLAENEHVLVFVPHHFIWDGWSFDVFQADLAATYGAFSEGRPSPLPELPVSYGDYASWYCEWLAGDEARAQLDYWKQRFAQVPPARAPRTDLPRRAGMSGEGGSCFLRLDKATSERLREVGRRYNVTLNMVSLGLVALMMSSVTGDRSVAVATPVRGRELPELENVMGFFNNLLVQPFVVDGSQSLGDFLQSVKAESMAAMKHQQIPFELVAAENEFTRSTQGGPLYQVLFSFQDARERPREIGALRHEQIHLLQRGATNDLGLWLMDKPNGIEGAVSYNADVYLRETGEAFRDRYVELLQRLADQPEQTLESICAIAGSPSALYLQRLAADADADALAETPAPEEPARAAQSQTLLLPEQARLAQIWASALSIDVNEISANDSFFDLGGDSLLAMRVIQQAEQVMGFRVEPRRYVFETLGQLASAAAGTPINAIDAMAAAAPVEAESRRGLLGRVFSGWGRKN